MSTITKNVRTENLKRRLKESFCLMDTDTDGYLDYHEMKAALKALGFAVKKSYILSIIRMYDKLSEKLNKRKPLDEIKYVFKLFTNETANDKITVEDLQKLNKKLDCNLTNEEMELMIKEFDLDQDGSIDQSEFLDIMADLTF
ncbi:uncharacterized protein LOC126865808 [Bombus huntii]|uniref:uncharacterized protein LOC126865808 n=1 Tax=Bombus huntii TaxID=85661 RepID=UPI000623DF49|nr:uncharacterized protein LOC126865808 [Bombus huntii]